jgi:excisionase family DNA binding protein
MPNADSIDLQAIKQSPTVSIEVAGKVLGVSRAYTYEMARTGRLPTIALGPRRKRVPTVALLRMLQLDD